VYDWGGAKQYHEQHSKGQVKRGHRDFEYLDAKKTKSAAISKLTAAQSVFL